MEEHEAKMTATQVREREINTITQEEIKALMIHRGLTLDKVIDAAIDINGIIGVGLISLADGCKDYIMKKI